MTSHRFVVLLLAGLFWSPIALVTQSNNEAERVRGWSSDVDYWLGELGRQHYVLRRQPLPGNFREAGDRFKQNVANWSDERALAEMMRLAAMAGDGHTYVLPFGAARVPTRILPLRFYHFADGLFVIDAEPGLERWIGAEVRSIAGVPIATLTQRLRPFIARDNDYGILWAGPFLLRFVGYLEALTEQRLADAVPVRLHIRTGETTVILHPVPPPRMRGLPKLIPSRLAGAPPPPLWLRDVQSPYWMQPLDEHVLYVQFNQVQDGASDRLADFAARLQSTLKTQKPRELIMDVRHNNGGNADLLNPLIEVLRDFSGGSGGLTVISGRNTFSAGQIFLARAEHEAHARVAGEPSSSKPNFVGEENNVMLPWSGAIASISNRYHETIPGDQRQWIAPHPQIVLRSADYFANRDPVLEKLVGRRVLAATHQSSAVLLPKSSRGEILCIGDFVSGLKITMQ